MRVHPGYNPFEFELVLGPGEQHVTPAVVCGVSVEGWGGASRRLHAFTRERVLPRPVEMSRFRPVLYNSWEATYLQGRHAGQTELARKAAKIGVELFCMDDGWFGARDHDRAGLGDWFVNTRKFPNGLKALIDHVNGLGMKFGLWVEPEMVNPDSDLFRKHPDWSIQFPEPPAHRGAQPVDPRPGARRREGIHLLRCSTSCSPKTTSHFIKWDMNRHATEPGSAAPAEEDLGEVRHQRLRDHSTGCARKHPELEIEACSGGGGRDRSRHSGARGSGLDVATTPRPSTGCASRTVSAWPIRARAMEAWVTEAHNTLTDRYSRLSTRFDVAMRGALGIGSNLMQLDAMELAEYAAYIAFYKRIRPVVQEGALYRLERLAGVRRIGHRVRDTRRPEGGLFGGRA